jgi:DNA-binding NarL/FixJ family response regulator/HPt (histidine-containing phosphotransfer) domain-containing protein
MGSGPTAPPPESAVLVVDDNPGDARLVEWALTHEPGRSFRVVRADRVAAALERLGEERFSAVLLDLGLPDSHGTEGIRRIRARSPGTAVVVLTGSDDPERTRAALAAGAQAYRVKGIFSPGELSRTLDGAIRRQRLEEELRSLPADEAFRAARDSGLVLALLLPRRPPLVSAEFESRTGLSQTALADPSWSAQWIARDDGGDPAATAGGDELLAHSWVVPGGHGLLVFPREGGELATGSRAAPATDTVIDPTEFARLEDLAAGDPEFVGKVIDAFLEESAVLVAAIQQGSRSGDATLVGDAAHQLKSGAAQVGALELSRHAAALQRAGERKDLPAVREGSDAVERTYPMVVRALEERRARRPGPA